MAVWALDVPLGSPSIGAAGSDTEANRTGEAAADANRLAWEGVIDRFLIPWGHGHIEVDDDLIPPTPASIRTAVALARRLRDGGYLPPTDVLPSGNGGVWLENRRGPSSVQIEVLQDGSVGRSEFADGKFVEAALLPASSFVSV